MWLILDRALEDFNIRETVSYERGTAHHNPEADSIRHRVSQEALHAALRISALVSLIAPPSSKYSVFHS